MDGEISIAIVDDEVVCSWLEVPSCMENPF